MKMQTEEDLDGVWNLKQESFWNAIERVSKINTLIFLCKDDRWTKLNYVVMGENNYNLPSGNHKDFYWSVVLRTCLVIFNKIEINKFFKAL